MAALSQKVEAGTASRRTRLPSLTGLRFIAAAMVFCLLVIHEHVFASPAAETVYFKIFWLAGAAGVSCFFILSGFVLTWSARQTDTKATFWRRRACKIYPNHLVTFVVALAGLIWVQKATVDGGVTVLNLFLVQSYSPDLEVRASVNSVAWSLSCEALFYFAFPFLISLVKRIRPERLWAWTAGVVALIFLVPVLAGLLPDQEPFPVVGITEWDTYFIYQLPPVRMLDFVFGILLARIVMTGQRLPLSLRGAALLAVVAFAVEPLVPPRFSIVAFMTVPLGLLIAAGAVADTENRPTWLSGRVMVWLGEVSFAFYMWVQLVLTYGHQLLGGGSWDAPAAFGVAASLFAATLLLAWLLFSLVERPVMRRFATPRRRLSTVQPE
ncbi:acyltransferase family protein [Streptosporangium carneum]|uniref:Acyltransferase n=1 Tax=Streptosporangium carneum TaxID=47481 RepID=A0A9W6MBG4_9ACTN|nr:acyltransferase [Streptosporangium carneum]GLK08289.1 acyltransferase [Streptosporangium carneum]